VKHCAWLVVAMSSMAVAQNAASWKFAISGDSRNCGDIMTLAIAHGVRQSGAEFGGFSGDLHFR
jgi:hypothetical protein